MSLARKGVKVNLVTVSASIGEQREIGKKTNFECDRALRRFEIKNSGLVTSLDEVSSLKEAIKKPDLLIISVATGGTEKLIRGLIDEVGTLTLLYPTFANNSFASCMEVLGRRKRSNVRLILQKKEKGIERIGFYINLIGAIKRLGGSTLGIVGGVSPWLMTSTEDEALIRKKLGVKTVKIELSEVLDNSKVFELEAEKVYKRILDRFDEVVEPKQADVLDAVTIYLAIKGLMKRKDFDSVTIRCFDLIQTTKNTACLALSLLNDEGLVAGCEGDVDSVLTMMVLRCLSNQPSFMANLNDLNVEDNTIILTHCTISTLLCRKRVLRSHFESKIGVAIQGELPTRKVTICRIGDELKKMTILTGKIVKNLNDPDMCRTQIEVRLDGKVTDLVSKTLGNHHVLTLGDFTEDLTEFCRLKNIEPLLL